MVNIYNSRTKKRGEGRKVEHMDGQSGCQGFRTHSPRPRAFWPRASLHDSASMGPQLSLSLSIYIYLYLCPRTSSSWVSMGAGAPAVSVMDMARAWRSSSSSSSSMSPDRGAAEPVSIGVAPDPPCNAPRRE